MLNPLTVEQPPMPGLAWWEAHGAEEHYCPNCGRDLRGWELVRLGNDYADIRCPWCRHVQTIDPREEE